MRRVIFFLGFYLLVTGIIYPSAFEFVEKKLTVKSSNMELVIEGGAVTSLKNIKTGELFTDSNQQGQTDELFKRSKDVLVSSDSDTVFRQVSTNEGEITYKNLINGDVEDNCIYKIKTNDKTGEISIQIVYRLSDASKKPAAIPVVNLAGSSTILGRGVEHFRDDPPKTDYSVRLANNLFAPPVCVVEGKKTSLFFYPDTFNGRGNVTLQHKKECDNLLLSSERNYKETDKNTTTSLTWTIGIYPDWFAAAKHYRTLFKENTGARFLWENNCKWFGDIHSVHTGMPPGGHNPSAEVTDNYYKNLAAITDPKRTLLFYWNGNGIVLFGDHRYMTNLGRPKPYVVDALKKYNFRWFAYHPYDLVIAPHRIEQRLKEVVDKKWGLPEGYTFQPDYDGKPEDFYRYFRDVAAGYYGDLDTSKNLWVLHPGSRKVRDYLVRNYGNYCRYHRADGAYLDILGTDSSHHFTEDKKIIDGSNYRDGKAAFLSEANKRYPDLPIMSECLGEWAVPYVPYTWEGAGHFYHPTAPPMNHPLRTAIWGSFTWARDSSHSPYQSALVGALPGLDINDEWSIARAKLFNDAGLHNDLPDRWDEDLVAHYRSREGKTYQYRRMPFGEAFVESVRGKYITRLGVFKGVYQSPLSEPVKITNWPGYKNNRPIGLNPAASYPFIIQTPPAGDAYTVSGLPDKAFIAGIRHGKKWSVLELGTADGKIVTGELTVVFRRDCLRISTAEKEIPGPFKAGEEKRFSMTLPDGLVFVWEEPESVDSRFRSNLVTETGRILSTGLQDRQWSYNSFMGTRNVTFNNITYPTIDVGFGRYRGYSEGWVELVGTQPVLRFDLGYPVPEKRRLPEVEASVLVNGRQVWKQDVKTGKEWQPQEVSLKGFAGRKVLVTLSAKVKGCTEVPAGPAHSPVSFGRVRIDNNPDSLKIKTGEGLPKPAEIIFAEDFDGDKLGSEWKQEISPANGSAGKIEVKDGMLALTSKHYKYHYVYREIAGEGNENISVQARLRVSPTGCSPSWNPGIGLYWDNGKYIFITGGGYLHKENGRIALKGFIGREMPLKEDRLAVTDENFYDFWVKIGLSSDKVRLFYSVDGEMWKTISETARPKEISGEPKVLIAGSGTTGEGRYFSNDERWDTGIGTDYILEIIAGRE
jgi:hypothetical protein